MGQAAETDSLQLEERLLAEDALFRELSIAEDELVDEYLSGKLSDAEMKSFEDHFLIAPERRQKLRFARSFRTYVKSHADAEATASAPHGPENSVRRFFSLRSPSLAYSIAAMVLVAIAVSWFVLKNVRNPAGDPGNVFVVTLTPGLTRDSQSDNKITIPPNTDSVRLQLLLSEDSYRDFEIELQDSAGQTLTNKQNLPSQTATGRTTVTVDIPSNLLRPGDYRVKLSGLATQNEKTNLASYSFTVLNNK